jgi:hypothetical protein
VKVYCHLCGATLRRQDQYRPLVRPDEQDTVFVCTDEQRCEKRAAFDPVTGRPHAGRRAADTRRPVL